MISLARDDNNNPALTETILPGARISGAVVVGVQVQKPSEGGPSLRGFVPKTWAGDEICVNIITADGLYEANGQYVVPADWKSATSGLQFPTRHADLLRTLPADGLGVLVVKGACGAKMGGEMSVALWNASDVETIDLIVNSFRADTVFAYVDNADRPVMCTPVEVRAGTAFDTKCPLDAGGRSGLTKVDIYRVVGGKPSRPTSLRIWFPDR